MVTMNSPCCRLLASDIFENAWSASYSVDWICELKELNVENLVGYYALMREMVEAGEDDCCLFEPTFISDSLQGGLT